MGFPEITFLGYICGQGKFSLGEERYAKIRDFPRPRSKKALQSFLGTANFFRQFVPALSSYTAPLTSMTTRITD